MAGIKNVLEDAITDGEIVFMRAVWEYKVKVVVYNQVVDTNSTNFAIRNLEHSAPTFWTHDAAGQR